MITKQDVAKRSGISWRTVHRAIIDPGLVDSETLARIKTAMDDLGYTGEQTRRGRRPSEVPLIHQVSLRVDERTGSELARRGEVLTTTHGPKSRGWDAEIIRLALDWAFNPPQGDLLADPPVLPVAPMPDDYRGFVDRISPPSSPLSD